MPPTFRAPLLRLLRSLAAVCLLLALLSPNALALLSLANACGKQCCRPGAKSCCRRHASPARQQALSAPACATRCAALYLPALPIALNPGANPAHPAPPPTPSSISQQPASALPAPLETIQLHQRPPPPRAALPTP